MSASPSQEFDSAAFLRSYTSNNYCMIAAFVVYLYDRCLGAKQEIDCIWCRRVSAVSVLYILLQAVTISWFLLQLVQNLVALDCNVPYLENIPSLAADILYYMTLAVISSLRAYAINPRGLTTPVVVFLLSSAPTLAFDIIQGVTIQGVPIPCFPGCILTSVFPSLRAFVPSTLFYAVVQATSIAADGIVLIVTLRRTYHTIRVARSVNISSPLSMLLWRDGQLLTLVRILDAAFYYTEVIYGFNYLATSFSSIILSRLFLNLRGFDQTRAGAETPLSQATQSWSHPQSRAQFTSVLGAPLVFVGDDDGDSEDAETYIDENHGQGNGDFEDESRTRVSGIGMEAQDRSA
ncbi:hypothetical protein DAEQUDRAFT_723726 [Daedalea quercina L-15889]|uniref:DUF6533 domain-containing protein n=1 Tax=Daedalea quercina L-15889 TaxID=1314783 RepID=A0A165S8L8_9APHY|nr:hypothetical protein DAEQUDRAFT_723726 [Daedalea quercina L-15889]